MTTISRRMMTGVAACGLGVLALGGPFAGPLTSVAAAQTTPSTKAEAKADAAKPRRVTIIFRSGNQVTGELLSETESGVKLRLDIKGMRAEADYAKADILEIKDLPDAAEPGTPGGGEGKATDKATDKRGNIDSGNKDLEKLKKDHGVRETKETATRGEATEAGGPKVYLVELKGEFARDVNVTPMREVVADIKKFQPEVVVFSFEHDFINWGEETDEFWHDKEAFGTQLRVAQQLSALIIDETRIDPGFKVKPRMVAWVKKALGGAAFLPFAFTEIYYGSEALHGGIGYLEHKFDGRGDERTREKQISLLEAWGKSMMEQGGYDSRLMMAMARTEYVLLVTFKDGVPRFIEGRMPESPDEILLTDDGKDANQDAAVDIIRFKGNDVLTLSADMARRLGISKGTADTFDDLMSQMRMPRNYELVKGKSGQVLKEWSRIVSESEAEFDRLRREFGRLEVRPPGQYRERTAFRGKQKQILRQIQGVLNRCKESINPRRLQNMPEGWINEIDRLITEIDAQQQADKPER